MNTIINGMEPGLFFVAMFFCLMGFILHKLVSLTMRDRKSQRTPGKYSFSFWLRDNWKEAAIHVILMFLGVLFTPWILEQIHGSPYTPAQISKLLTNAPAMLIYTAVGWVVAAPMEALKKNYKKVVEMVASVTKKSLKK